MMDSKISELICTRLSHDIAGNIGAVANAVELLEEGDIDFLDDIKGILKTSSQVLAARLKFFRMTFGLENADLADAAKVSAVAQAYVAAVSGKNPPTLAFSAQEAAAHRVMLAAVMLCADVLIKGGKITAAGRIGQAVVAVEPTAAINSERWQRIRDILSGAEIEAVAQDAPAFFLHEFCRERHIRLVCGERPELSFIWE